MHLPTLLLAALLTPFIAADCECGYALTLDAHPPQPDERHVFTELTESNFARLHAGGDGDIRRNTDWAPQAFNVSAERGRGAYGEMFSARNIDMLAGDGGLRLTVGSELVRGMVPTAEVATRRLDMMWGTFRASMRLTGVEGTCAAFFWYFNDTQEIDMEFLSKDFNHANGSYPVNLVLQSLEAAAANYDASHTGSFVRAYLPFDPTAGFHEYRIDYFAGRVRFYADGVVLAQMDGPAVPVTAGHLIMRHWSNGNKLWSGGPPERDAAVVVKYVKAYFNSSSPKRQGDWERRCRNPKELSAVCDIPNVTAKNLAAQDWFFSENANMTNNQTVHGLNGVSGRRVEAVSGVMWALLLVSGCALVLL
ncbi:glycoside hydrolase, family 16 [Schizothecium vesticola]|uniref:Glycoside hydrolase, family 16 n=1 Tax=Schizothecium vesticola TaxID=314040 RepID=A0AA40KC08_9PEZI|nr:glycoside hydrolase, family 16 [Schizothecium vesticola]